MRFRTRFGISGYVSTVMAVFYLFSWARSGHCSTAERWALLAFAAIVAVQGLSRTFVYWDVDASGIRERWFWRTKSVPWNHVKRVVAKGNFWGLTDFVTIEYAIPASPSKAFQISAGPTNGRKLTVALRRFATQAEFDA